MRRTSLHSWMINTWIPLHEDNMSSPLPADTIMLNAAELKKTIVQALLSSSNHHYYLSAATKKFTALKNCDETELTVMYHNYLTSANKNQDYISLSGCLLFSDKLQQFFKNFANEFLINITLNDKLLKYQDKNPLDWTIHLNKTWKQIAIQQITEMQQQPHLK